MSRPGSPPSTAVRPARPSGAATRERLVTTAASLFHTHGVAGTGLDAVLRSAGASKSQLYSHVSGKQDLVLEVVAHQRRAVLGPMTEALAAVQTRHELRQWLEGVVADALTPHGAHGCPLGTLANELADVDETARRALADCFAGWREAIVDALLRLKDRQEVPPHADADGLARAFLALLEGGWLLARTERDPRNLAAAAAACMALLDA